MYYAHSRNPHGHRQMLVTHLRNVADLAADFAAAFGASEPARYLGLWHDLGKFNLEFQKYLLACEANPATRGHGPDHKAAGAQLARQHLGLVALLVQAHHGGLQTPTDFKTWLARKATDSAVAESLERARREIADLEPGSPIPLPNYTQPQAGELFLRLLFSALVDADHLDTERHFQTTKAAQRGTDVTLAELWERFERSQQQLSGQNSDTVNQARHAIYQACLAAAAHPPGLFRLTVPTGGGKTRSAMAFALRHALCHGQRRVIVAVPFISITEQTADVYREIFYAEGDARPVVLEHHSAVAGRADEDDFHPQQVWARLAAENWDAPIIVTTTVQLLESLFSNQTSACRKLHRLARSVIILDEAQALPPHLLDPILDVLRQLCEYYGTTVVLSTATQPAFEAIQVFSELPATEIVPNADYYFSVLKRVNYEWRTQPALTWAQVAAMMREGAQALAVVNTKKDAIALLDALGDPTALHLSTLLCGAHRRKVIAEVKQKLTRGEACRLVSTQVIEAGVDLDFPLVLRALGPLDGIIQAAGRCNREGRLGCGRVIVFQPAEGGLPTGVYHTASGITGALLGGGSLDLDDPAVPRQYFQRLFETVETDREHIQKLREALNYPEVAKRFRMIDDDTESLVITNYGSEEERQAVRNWLDRLRQGAPNARALLRRLQPYIVSVRRRQVERYRQLGLIADVLPGLGEWLGAYDPVRGLVGEGPDVELLVV